METIKKILNFVWKYRDIFLIGLVVLFVFISAQQCTGKHKAEDEIARVLNNELALTDTLKTYRDSNGNLVVEKHALQLTQKELREEVDLLKKKNRDYVAYINSHLGIVDTVNVETVIVREVHDTVYMDSGKITASREDTFGKSYRQIGVEIPYTVDTQLHTGDATFSLNQDIFVEGALERNTKTGETYMMLRSDYPGLTFNSGMGVVADPSKKYERDMRKSQGIGICIGPSLGLDYNLMNKSFGPTVGVNVTIGWTYTPKWAQWGK